MGETGVAPDGGYRRRLFGTTRRKVAAVALSAVVVVAVVVAAGLLMRSGAPVPARTAGKAHAAGKASATGTFTSGSNFLSSMSCVSRAFCVAVGSYGTSSSHGRTLIESWDGSRWSIGTSANAGTDDQLQGVSCVSRAFCEAVGSYHTGTGRSRTLIESWDGERWSLAASPNTSAADGDNLVGVSCASGGFCTAVGDYHSFSTNLTYPLIESWDGARWSIARNGTPSYGSGKLAGVSCTSARACTAVGIRTTPSPEPLLVSSDGSRWSTAVAPRLPSGNQAIISGVSCTSGNFCVATGNYPPTSARGSPPLVASWDGTHWSTDTTPPMGGAAYLFGVSCAGSTDCMATGYRYARGAVHSLIELWDGSRWSTTATPTIPASRFDGLPGVSCVPEFCATAGYSTSGGHARTLIELWDGTRWSIAPSPDNK